MTPRFPGIKRIIHFAFGRRGLEAEIDAEVAFHLESTIEELEASGMSPQEAKEEAERRFGSLPTYKAALTRIGEARRSDEQRKEYFDIIRQHLRYTWRGIVRQPGFAITIAMTLALGIGANAIMFGIIDRLMLRAPEHIVEPERVRLLYINRPLMTLPAYYPALSMPQVEDLREAKSFSVVAPVANGAQTVGERREAHDVPSVLASHEFFALMGTQPALGRFFTPADDSASLDNATVVLGYDFWRREMGHDVGVIGKSLQINHHRYIVIGVAPPGFTGADLGHVDLWMPFYSSMDERHGGKWWRTKRDNFGLRALVRLKDGVSPQIAEAEVIAIAKRHEHEIAERDRWHAARLASLIPSESPDRPAEISVALWLGATSVLVLLVAIANVATLLLARAIQRRREIAVRIALGIGRRQLIGHLVAESMTLAVGGGLIALVITALFGHAISVLLLPQIAWAQSTIDTRTGLFILGVSGAVGLLASMVPAILESGSDLTRSLKSGARSGRARSRLSSALVIAQASLSTALLIGAGLFVLSLARVRALDLGMHPAGTYIVAPEFSELPGPPQLIDLLRQSAERLKHLPVIEGLAITSAAPLSQLNDFMIAPLSADSAARIAAFYNAVTPGYFGVIGTQLMRGRLFDETDSHTSPKVTIVSQSLASAFWHGMDPIGRCLGGGSGRTECLRVIGVVADAHWAEVFADKSPAYYIPLEQSQDPLYTSLIVRVRDESPQALASIRNELIDQWPTVRSVYLHSLQERVDPSFRSWRLGATLFLAFGALALVVAAIGLYSVMACRVAQRRHELGVRSALGASWRDLIEMVAREGIQLVGGGILLGLLVAVVAAPAIAPLLYQTSPRDPQVLLVVVVVLLVAALVACAVPAWRASRVDPLEALKAE